MAERWLECIHSHVAGDRFVRLDRVWVGWNIACLIVGTRAGRLCFADGIAVDTSNSREVEAYHDYAAAHGSVAPLSREVLQVWRGVEV